MESTWDHDIESEKKQAGIVFSSPRFNYLNAISSWIRNRGGLGHQNKNVGFGMSPQL